MGRFLISTFTEDGFLFPAVGLAKQLCTCGHSVAIIADEKGATRLKELNVSWLEVLSASEDACAVKHWGDQDAILQLLPTIRRAISFYQPDALIVTPLSIGALVVGEEEHIPTIVLGFASYLLPRIVHENKISDHESDNLRRWRYSETSSILEGARLRAGLGPSIENYENTRLNGILHLLRTVPALERGGIDLPKCVRFVGACLWEPAALDEALVNTCNRSSHDGVPVIYAQVGRSFKSVSLWSKLVEAFANEKVFVVAAVARCDMLIRVVPKNFLVVRTANQGSILPATQLVVCDGHSTATLGALSDGVPLVLMPNGSGTEEVALMCERSGAASVLPNDGNHHPDALRKATFAAMSDHDLHQACKKNQKQFSQYEGFGIAVTEIESQLH